MINKLYTWVVNLFGFKTKQQKENERLLNEYISTINNIKINNELVSYKTRQDYENR